MEKAHSDILVDEIRKQEADAVPTQYRGTDIDKADMAVLGKKQVLRRTFGFITMLGFTSATMGSWEFVLPLFTFGLEDGGLALLFWGYIALMTGQLLVYASLAEMASMSPTAGGQYHWVSELAPPKYQKIWSYLTGWLTALGWQAYLAGTAFVAGTTIQGLLALNYENYIWHQWHGTLLTIAVIAAGVAFNTVLAVYLSAIEGVLLILHICGFFAIIIPLWVMAPHGSARDVLLTFSNSGGWSSTGLAAMIGLTGPIGTVIGYDCGVHMSEEARDASRMMPKALMWSCAINFAVAFTLIITLIFSVGDIDSILSTKTGSPWIQLIYNATQSYKGTNAMVSIVTVLYVSCTFNLVATSSRQMWSFSRDRSRGFPFSDFLSKVNTRWNTPLRATFVIIIATASISCINLGSTVALNAFNSLGGVSVLTSYGICIGCMIHRRLRGPPLPPRRWSLGRYGLFINIAAFVFLTPVWFFVWWPLVTPVTATNMNWASVMFVGVTVIAIAYYFLKARRGQYVGPVVSVKRD